MKAIEWFFMGLLAVLAALTLFLAGMGVDYLTGRTDTAEVTVLEKVYAPAQTGVGVGTGVGSNGGVATGIITSRSPEKFTLVVDAGGEVRAVEVSAPDYVGVEKGHRVKVQYTVGGFSGYEYW